MSPYRTMSPYSVPSALIVSWDAYPPVETFSTVLREHFGYNTIPLRLPERNPEKVLRDSLANALASHSHTDNPFILYCYSNSLMRPGESRFQLSQSENSVSLDWLKLRQEYIDKFDSNILVILDCNHKVLPTGVSRYPILADDKNPGSGSIVQILVAPTFSEQNATPFLHVLTQALKALAESSRSGAIDIRYLIAEIPRHWELELSAEPFRLRPGQEDLKLVVSSQEVQHSFRYPWYEPFRVKSASKHLRVGVLPITWAEVDLWDPQTELKELLDVFESHFDFMIERIVKIPNTPDAQSFLQTRINQQIDKVGSKGLLIVLYNGHGRRTDEGMMLFGVNDDGQNVNWTEITHTLNIANCDVVHVLDCCDALSATKGSEADKKTQVEITTAANWITNDSQYQGRNETLAASAREQRVPAGSDSSMKVFATVLREMAVRRIPITTHSWQQRIVTKMGEMRRSQGRSRLIEPHYKMNPGHFVGESIQLQVKQRRSTM